MSYFINKNNFSFININPFVGEKDIDDLKYKEYIKYKESEDWYECDELMVPIITKLNIKGWKTKYCCSGHINRLNTRYADMVNEKCYIMFDKGMYSFFNKTNIPEGFIIRSNSSDGSCTISKVIGNEAVEDGRDDRLPNILNAISTLWEWVNKLPSIY